MYFSKKRIEQDRGREEQDKIAVMGVRRSGSAAGLRSKEIQEVIAKGLDADISQYTSHNRSEQLKRKRFTIHIDPAEGILKRKQTCPSMNTPSGSVKKGRKDLEESVLTKS